MAFHMGHTHAERLIRSPLTELRSHPISPDSTAIVSGGTKGLGFQYALGLIRDGYRCAVLTSRNPRLTKAELVALAERGAAVFVVKSDAGCPSDSRRVMLWAHENLPAIAHFAHAAGVLGFDTLDEVTPEAFWAVCAPKAAGAASAAQDARLPVLQQDYFSSTAAVWSQPGAAHYSAANSFLNAAAAESRWCGLPATAVNFGPFSGVGMAAEHAGAMASIGLQGLQPGDAYQAFNAAGYSPKLVRVLMDVGKFTKLNTVKGPWPFLDRLIAEPAALPAAAPLGPKPVTSGAAKSAPGMTVDEIVRLVRSAAAEVLGEDLGAEGRFSEGHFDSLSAVELSNIIGRCCPFLTFLHPCDLKVLPFHCF